MRPPPARTSPTGAPLLGARLASVGLTYVGLTCVGLLLAAAGPAATQERLPGGRVLTFGTTIGLASSDNYALDPGGPGRSEATLGLSLGLVAATPIDRFELDSDIGFRVDTRGGGVQVTRTNLALSWVRTVRNAQLQFDASVRRDEIEDLSPFDLVVGEDLDLLNATPVSGSATRLVFSTKATLELGRAAPLGTTLSLGLRGTRYDGAGPSYEDNTGINAGLRIRADLDPVTEATLDLAGTTYVEGTDSDVLRLTLGLARTGPTASVGASLGVVTEDAGTQTSLSVNGTLERPLARLTGRLGIARGTSGDLALIGGAGLAMEFRLGDLSIDLDRRVSFVENGTTGITQERAVTTLRAGWDQSLTELWQLGLDGRYVHTETVGGGGADSYGELGGTLSRPLTRDWTVNFGLRHRFEINDTGPNARASSASVSLSRVVRRPF